MDDEADDQMKMDLEASGAENGSPQVEPEDSDKRRPSDGTAAPSQSSSKDLESTGEAPPQPSDPRMPEREEEDGDPLGHQAPRTSRRSGGTLPPSPHGGLSLPPELSEHWCFKVKEVAPLVQLSEKTVRREIWAGRLEAVKLGGSIRISRGALKAWLKRRESGGSGR